MNYFFLVLLGFAVFLEAGHSQVYPEILKLSVQQDLNFRQHQDALTLYLKRVSRGDPLPDLLIFQYKLTPQDSIFTLSSRTGLPYETLASLNGLDSPGAFTPGLVILIPSIPGVFVDTHSPSELGSLMGSLERKVKSPPLALKLPTGKGLRSLLFYPGERFHPLERAFFLGILFRFPLGTKARVTSFFGRRSDPFSGHPSYHNGVDLGAPTGTEVLAARDGFVKDQGVNRVFGNFVLLEHPGGYETLYGHLSLITTSLKDRVSSGTIIGRVGSTGQSTGPHLHFEIRRQGHPQDPVPMLPH